MKTIIFAIASLLTWQQSQQPPVTYSSGPISKFTEPASLAMPRVVIHFSGPIVLEINSDGKHLTVNADGAVTGDLPHDKAADEFWKNIAKAVPGMCQAESERGRTVSDQEKETLRLMRKQSEAYKESRPTSPCRKGNHD